jgi:hypothetical protein
VIAALAAQQDAVMAVWQLLRRGVTHRQIQARVRKRVLHRVHRGVYSVIAPAILSRRGHLIAALLIGGHDAFLSHAPAAAEWDVIRADLARIELTLPGRSSAQRPPMLILHRTERPVHPDELTRDRGMLISTVPRVLIELAPHRSVRQLEDLITEAVHHHKHFDLKAIEATIQRHPHRPGMKDHRKDTALQHLGIRPMRIGEDRWRYNKNGILDDLHQFMGIS